MKHGFLNSKKAKVQQLRPDRPSETAAIIDSLILSTVKKPEPAVAVGYGESKESSTSTQVRADVLLKCRFHGKGFRIPSLTLAKSKGLHTS